MNSNINFSLAEETYLAIRGHCAKNYPHLLDDDSFVFFVENLLVGLYSHYQPQDLLFDAIDNSATSGYHALKLVLSQEEAAAVSDQLQGNNSEEISAIFRRKIFNIYSKLQKGKVSSGLAHEDSL